MFIICSLLLCICVTIVNAQGQQQNQPQGNPIVPLAPNVAELFKYTSIPVTPMTGVPDISYPLYEVNTGKIKVPITLSYHASGIKVTQRATWVGLGWSLFPGGNVARTVRGIEDENDLYGWFNHHHSIDTVQQIQDYSLMQAWALNMPDGQPDFFNFNLPGKSGRFFWSRASQHFITVPYKPVQITRTSDNKYQVTDDDGTRYYFNDVQYASTQSSTGIHNSPQSWNLSEIISNDKQDTVFFTYGPSVGGVGSDDDNSYTFSKNYDYINSGNGGGVGWVAQEVQKSTTSSGHYNLVLQQITFRQGKVVFYANTSRKDAAGSALDSMVVYRNNAGVYERVKKTSMAYDYFFDGTTTTPTAPDYRLRLLSFTNEGVKGGLPETYHFDYNQTPLPSIYSTSQDYWGFYNGTVAKTTLVPNIIPDNDILAPFGPVGEADRNTYPLFMMAGMLQKVTFPTGGYTTFEFESNKYTQSSLETGTSQQQIVTATAHGSGATALRSVPDLETVDFTIPEGLASNDVILNAVLSPFSNNAIEASYVTITDLTTGQIVGQLPEQGQPPVYSQANNLQLTVALTPSKNYRLSVYVHDINGVSVQGNIVVTVLNPPRQVDVGGVRIAGISTYDNNNVLQKREVYKYGPDENGSGSYVVSPYDFIYKNYSHYRLKRVVFTSDLSCGTEIGERYTYLAQSVLPTIDFMGAPVFYPHVVKYEMDKDSVPNGKTVYQYIVPNDYAVLPNENAVDGHEYIDNSFNECQLDAEVIYKYDPIGKSYKVLQHTQNYYTILNAAHEQAVQVMQTTQYLSTDRCNSLIDDFTYLYYPVNSGCYQLSSTFTDNFDDAGDSVHVISSFSYNKYAYPKRSVRIDSKGDSIIQAAYYPGDTEQEPGNINGPVLNKMVARNMINKPYWTGSYNNNKLLRYKRTIFSDGWNTNDSLIAPARDSFIVNQPGDHTPANVISYVAYSPHGNLTEMKDATGIFSSYTWDASDTYPISQTIDAPLGGLIYDGFEDVNTWQNIKRDNGHVHTGRYAGLLNGTSTPVNRWLTVGIASPTSFKYSGWVYSSGPGVSISLLMKRSGETGAYSYIDNVSTSQSGGWVYLEKEFPVPADVKQMGLSLSASGSGSVWFDDIKFRPSIGQMSSFTYDPLIGMTSKTDEGNHTLYYEYDGLGRLIVVRDKDGNIIKQYCYKYAGQTGNCK